MTRGELVQKIEALAEELGDDQNHEAAILLYAASNIEAGHERTLAEALTQFHFPNVNLRSGLN